MAPTICEDRERNTSNIQRSRNHIIKHRNSSVISYADGRKTTARNIPSDSVNNGTSSSSMRIDKQSTRSPNNLLNISEYRHLMEHNNRQQKLNIDDSSMDSQSSSYAFHNYSKRLNDGGDHQIRNSTSTQSQTANNEDLLSLMPATPSTSTSSLYDDLLYSKRRSFGPQQHLTIFPVPSPSSSVSSTSDSTPSLLFYRLAAPSLPTPSSSTLPTPSSSTSSQQSGLFEIAMKTVKLLQKNRSLQARLEQLQVETQEFVESVMANPENAELRKRIKCDNSNKSNCVKQTFGFAITQ